MDYWVALNLLKKTAACQKNSFIFDLSKGDVAQLARALDWQSRGRRFESALLHYKTLRFTDSEPFFLQLSLQ